MASMWMKPGGTPCGQHRGGAVRGRQFRCTVQARQEEQGSPLPLRRRVLRTGWADLSEELCSSATILRRAQRARALPVGPTAGEKS